MPKTLRDWSIPIAIFCPIAFVLMGFLLMIGPFVGGTQLASLLFLWHLGCPVALFVHEIFRHRRGLGRGRGTPFAVAYFAAVDLIAVSIELGRGGIFIWLLLEMFSGFLLFIVLASAVGFGLSLWTLNARGERNAGNGVIMALSASLAGLFAVGSVYGIRLANIAIYCEVLSVQVLDATSRQPIGGCNVEYVGHVQRAIPGHEKTNSLGIVKLTDHGQNRLEFAQDGYRSQVVWFENGMVHVSWQEDGLWRPFDQFNVPRQRDRQLRSLTVYLRRIEDQAEPPYPFDSQKISAEHLHRMLFPLGYSTAHETNPNRIDTDGLADATKARFLVYRQRYNDFSKRLMERDHAKGWKEYRPQSKRTSSAPYGYWNHYEQKDMAALFVYSLLDGIDQSTAYSCVDELFSKKFRSCRDELYEEYAKDHPGGRLTGICLLQSMLWRRQTIEWIASANREKRMVEKSSIDRGNLAFTKLQELAAEAQKHPDPLIRVLAMQLSKADL